MSTPTHFNCVHCGKRYAWKPELAGKRAKCACGQMLTVPAGIAPAAVPEEDLYDFAEPEVKPKAVRPVTTVVQVAAPTGPGGGGAVLSYGSRANDADEKRGGRFDDFYYAPRDFYWPSGVLAAGFVALLAWAMTVGASGAGLFLFSAYVTVATVIKTAIMIGAAFVIAPMAGISFGTLWTAVLKLAAIVVMTDAALFWLQEIMEQLGAYPGRGAGRRSFMAVGLINTMLAAAIIAILSKIFFDMDREEVGTFAVPMAILNRVLNFLIMLLLMGIVSAIESAAAGPPAAPAGGGPAQTTPGGAPAPPPAPVTATDPPPAPANAAVARRDAETEALVRSRRVIDAFEIYKDAPGSGVPGNARQRAANAEFYAAHAARRTLMIGLRGAGVRGAWMEIGTRQNATDPARLIVEMPYRPEDRDRVIELLNEFAGGQLIKFDPATLKDEGNKYLSIPLKSVTRAGKK